MLDVGLVLDQDKSELLKLVFLLMKILIESEEQGEFLGEILGLEQPHQAVLSGQLENLLNSMVGGTPKKQGMDLSFASKLDSSLMNLSVDHDK